MLRRRKRLDHTHYDSLNGRITRADKRLGERLDELSASVMERNELLAEWLKDVSNRTDANEKLVAEAVSQPDTLLLLEIREELRAVREEQDRG